MDNSPTWDAPLRRIELPTGSLPPYRRKDTDHIPLSERPGDEEYDRFIYLLYLSRECRYREDEVFEVSPFIIQDHLFNALLYRASTDLYRIAEIVKGRTEEIRRWLDRTKETFNRKLWHEKDGFYYAFDMKEGTILQVRTAAGFVPLFGCLPSEEQAQALYRTLGHECLCKVGSKRYMVPNYDVCEPGFSPGNYWRGPIWININWLIYKGLLGYGNIEYATYVRDSIIDLVRQRGFFEYYDPIKGEGHGTRDFSWTAALLIDVLMGDMGAP